MFFPDVYIPDNKRVRSIQFFCFFIVFCQKRKAGHIKSLLHASLFFLSRFTHFNFDVWRGKYLKIWVVFTLGLLLTSSTKTFLFSSITAQTDQPPFFLLLYPQRYQVFCIRRGEEGGRRGFSFFSKRGEKERRVEEKKKRGRRNENTNKRDEHEGVWFTSSSFRLLS